jgi:hypothetical protein
VNRLFAAVLLLSLPCAALASPGRLDEKGCHDDPKTGKYHCHTSPNEVQTGESNSVAVIESGGTDDPKDDAMFKDCDAVRAAGLSPITKQDPGYSEALDPDGDGIGCD